MTKYQLKFLIPKLLFLAVLMIIQTGCQPSSNNTNDNSVFRYNEHKNISSLDPAFAKDNANIWAVNQLFNGLVQMGQDMTVKPCIAEAWEISKDGKQYTFFLRSDVYFHQHKNFGAQRTRLVKAQDFVFSFNRLFDEKIASPGGWVFNQIQSFEILNDYTLQINLKQPFPAFLGILTMKYCSVVPKEIVEDASHDFRSNPIGTGPFLFKAWSENNKLVFRRNPNYFEYDSKGNQLPYLEAIAITFLPDKQSEYLQFIQGNLDFVSGLDASYKDDILNSDGTLNHKYRDIIKMAKAPYLNTEYLGFFMESDVKAVQSKVLRKAFNYGFDRQKMIDYLRNGIGIPGQGGVIPIGLEGSNDSIGFSYDPKKAKQLINQFKTETGIQNPSVTIATNENYLSFCEFIQRSLTDIGLDVKIDVMPASALKSAKANGKTDLFRASWVADYPDAQNYLSLFYSKNFTPSGPNYTHFTNKEFDSMYDASMNEINLKKRVDLYRKMDRLVIDEAPVVILFYDEVVRLTQKHIIGLGVNATNLLDLKRVQKN